MTGKAKRIGGLILLALVGTALLAARHSRKAAEEDVVPTARVQKGPLTISVTAAGSIQSRDKICLSSELEGNNTVIWVIDEGATVKTGDLLLEFNASDLEEKAKEQEVTVVNTESGMIIAREKLAITQSENDSLILDRQSDLAEAETALEKYENGDYPQELKQKMADITLANEELRRAEEKVDWSKRLFKERYLTKTELQADQLSLQQKQIALEMAQTRLDVLTNYTVMQEKSSLTSAVRKATRFLKRTAWQSKATIRQIESELLTRTREYERATNRLGELRMQIRKSKIYAPTNGIVLYASTVAIARRQWWIKPLSVGATAVRRQDLIYIPLESGMIVETMIPEASLNKITVGMKAEVKVDAFPGQVFTGRLAKIGILPDGQSAQLNPDLKLYKCEIECPFNGVSARPGMSCSVELVKEVFPDALSLPVQCVVREGGVTKVYARAGKGFEPRTVETGLDNNRMVFIRSGVRPGDEVMLAPPIHEAGQEPGEGRDAAPPWVEGRRHGE